MRDIHDLHILYPKDDRLARWADAVHQLYRQARPSHIRQGNSVAPPNWPWNAAERSLRPVVISRKVSGGTRSDQGTDTKMTLASVFGTWRAKGLNTLTACQQLLASPQL